MDKKKNDDAVVIAERKIVKRNVKFNIAHVDKGTKTQSRDFSDNYFIVVKEKPTKFHSGLSTNDQDESRGNGGSFIVGLPFIATQAERLEIGVNQLKRALRGSELHIDVEERIHGGQAVDANGEVITFNGRGDTKEGDKYHVATNYRLVIPDEVRDQIDDRDDLIEGAARGYAKLNKGRRVTVPVTSEPEGLDD